MSYAERFYKPAHDAMDRFLDRIEKGEGLDAFNDLKKEAESLLEAARPAPEGFRLTGEKRIPKAGEWFLTSLGSTMKAWNGHGLTSVPILVPDNVYNKPLSEVEVPEGWEKTGEFREPREGESCLGTLHNVETSLGSFGPSRRDLRRLILRRKVDPIQKLYGKPAAEIQIPEGMEWTGEFRPGKKGEWFLSIEGNAIKLGVNDSEPRLILRLESSNPYGKPLSELKTPKGWRRVAYRKPLRGEHYLSAMSHEPVMAFFQTGEYRNSLVILEPLAKITFEETGEERKAKGEWFLNCLGHPVLGDSGRPVRILRKIA